MPVLYRIIRGRQFTSDDLRSNLARCKKRRTGEIIDLTLWAGVSMFDNVQQAGRVARLNRIGTQLARLDVPETDERIVLGPRSSLGHVTVWACDQVLHSCFRDVVPIP